MVDELNPDNFEERTKIGDVILDFYADWCGPCQMIKPVFEKLSNEFDDVHFFKINVDNNQQAATKFEVRSIPTLVFLESGKEVDRVIGVVGENELKHKLKHAFR